MENVSSNEGVVAEAMAKTALMELARLCREAQARFRKGAYRPALSSLEAIGEVLGPLQHHVAGRWSDQAMTIAQTEEGDAVQSSPLPGLYL